MADCWFYFIDHTRPEYWVLSKDVANTPDTGDELGFIINVDGSVEFSKNGETPRVFMHVDTSVPLWMFWDVYGNTQKMRLVGGTMDAVTLPDDSTATQENDRNNMAMTDIVGSSNGVSSPACPPLPPRSRSTHNIGSQSHSTATQSESSRYLATVITFHLSNNNYHHSRTQETRSDECKICYEATVDCVLYMCGHMCLCYQV